MILLVITSKSLDLLPDYTQNHRGTQFQLAFLAVDHSGPITADISAFSTFLLVSDPTLAYYNNPIPLMEQFLKKMGV